MEDRKRIYIPMMLLLMILCAGVLSACTGSGRSSQQEEDMKKDFKLIGYMPNWYSLPVLESSPIEKYTHINYAFGIPKDDGTMRDLTDKAFVARLIEKSHESGVKVLLSVGGWSYNNVILEPTFVKATETEEKTKLLAENIVQMAVDYGFDGVDLDWEHPNAQTGGQYEALVVALSEECKAHDLYLTCAVVGTSDMDKGITDKAAACFDWINVMCYDGGEGADHSPMSLAEDYIRYWTEKRGIPREKVTLGVPFYERPTWNAYSSIVAADPANAEVDTTTYAGKTIYYNGIPTMKEKTAFAIENAGGLMVWQITQDAPSGELSLLDAIIARLAEAGIVLH